MIQHPTHSPITSSTEFLKVYLERTLEGAVKAKSDTYSLGSQFDSKEAWENYMDLYDETIYRLNQSVLSCLTNACSGSDVQTWLSTTLTNLDTCREGMGVSSESLQSVLQSITIDVINALAIIKRLKHGMKTKEKYFGVLKQGAIESPTNGGRVDAVVALDGSGDYKTIQEAILLIQDDPPPQVKIVYLRTLLKHSTQYQRISILTLF
ncbi:unnamed protein product [Arabis nemorensis]|uniref:Pectinesterase inhibitor domain-containing protein n=1 Tax=Arabis nemorensis TaxID=586526 RepID=A0A565BZT1_9BRAS|nr:unnamed protein product [Arabis nemorensis]